MPRLNLPEVEAEMVDLARKRVELIAGDTPLLTLKTVAEIWGQSRQWVATMKAAGKVRTVPFGKREMVTRATAIRGLVRGV